MCRKLETEEEKVLPFYASTLTEEEESDVKQALMEPPGQQLAVVCIIYTLDRDIKLLRLKIGNERLFEH
jgi:hypothetical protein